MKICAVDSRDPPEIILDSVLMLFERRVLRSVTMPAHQHLDNFRNLLRDTGKAGVGV